MPSQPPSLRAPPRRGPYQAAAAEQDLASATSRDAVVRAFFDFASQYFEYSAVLAVHGEIAEGRDSRGPGADRMQITSIGVPLDLPSTLRDVRDEGRWRLARLASAGLDAGLANDLQRSTAHRVLLLPIIVRKRCVLILYGDHGNADVELSLIGDVIAFVPLVSRALERIIVERKRAVLQQLADPDAAHGPAPLRPMVSGGLRPAATLAVEDRAAALAHALAPPPAPRFGPDRGMAEVAPLVASPTVPLEVLPRHDADETPLVPAAALEIALQQSRDIPTSDETPVFPLTRRSVPPVPVRRSVPPVPAPPDIEEPPEEGWEEPRVASTTARAEVPEVTPTPLTAGDAAAAGPDVSLEVSEESDSPDVSFITEELDDGWTEDEADAEPPGSRVVSYAARAPQKPRESSREMALPTVIVDVASDCRVLVDKLVQGDADAEVQLAEMGEPALDALLSRFPGPLTEPEPGAAAAAGSRSGPILRAVVRFGPKAIPRLVKRAGEAAGIGRTWAIRLLGEIPGAESARALVPHLLDDDDGIRQAALDAGRLLQGDEDSRRTLSQRLGDLAGETVQSPDLRRRAIRALAGLREPHSVPALLRLLEQPDQDIAREALAALVAITVQDFGDDVQKWRDFWKRNQSRHRIEWLIDSLVHETVELRRAAGEELKATTKEYFGYYDDLPRKERIRAQKLYQQWWEAKGRSRFK
jgi:hypothetical protein